MAETKNQTDKEEGAKTEDNEDYGYLTEVIKVSRREFESCDDDYIGSDRLIHCGVCRQKKQTSIELLGKTVIVPCICQCQQQQLAKQRAAHILRRAEDDYFRFKETNQKGNLPLIKRLLAMDYSKSPILSAEYNKLLKLTCFSDKHMTQYTFQNDNLANPRISHSLLKYSNSFDIMLANNHGLYLHGPPGTGKTYFAAAIANHLTDIGIPVFMTCFEWIRNRLQEDFSGRNELIDNLKFFPLLIIDDYGTETETDFMTELIYTVLNERMLSSKPLIITSNIPFDLLCKTSAIKKRRCSSRITQMCTPIEVNGVDHRAQKMKEQNGSLKDFLSL